MSDRRRVRWSDPKPAPAFDELPASKKVTLPALKIGPDGRPVHYHYYDGTLYVNGRAERRRPA
jgi:hypothetical protein